ncbi:ssDNA endonuclease and repair protein rad10 [Thecaphora frezii]
MPPDRDYSGSGSAMRPVSSFQPASSLPRTRAAASSSTLSSSSTIASASASTSTSTSTSTSGPGVVQPRPRPQIRSAVGGGTTVLVNRCQRGNPVLQHIRNVGWEYGDIVPDYQTGVSRCILFLSLRYHRLHPEYIHSRIQRLGQMYTLRVLLVQCDVGDHTTALRELTKVAVVNHLTLMLAWSAEEAGKYVEMYKALENAPPDRIRERKKEGYLEQLEAFLRPIRGVNRTDAVTLAARFGSVDRLAKAPRDVLEMCPGVGERKAGRVYEVFRTPFRVGEKRTWAERRGRDVGEGEREAAAPADAPGAVAGMENTPVHLETVEANPTPNSSADATRTTQGTKRAADAIQSDLDSSDEEEQLRLAVLMSLHQEDEGDATIA